SQEEQTFTFHHTIQSKAFGDDRELTIYLPPAYYRAKNAKYAVTYVLDGHYAPFIDLVEKTIEYNVNARKFTPTIIVGIHAKNRGQEFWTPPRDQEEPGQAHTLQQHLREEVIPFVENKYDNLLGYRSIVGHSSGGAFVLATLFSEEQDLFDGYLAISPAIRPGGRRDILGEAAQRLATGKPLNKFLYASAGTVGEREDIFGRIVTKLDSTVNAHPNSGLVWEKTIFDGLDHWSVVAPSVIDGLIKQTRNLRTDEKHLIDFARNKDQTMGVQIEAFYRERKASYVFVDVPSAGYISRVADEVEWAGGATRAIELYDWALTQYPDDFYFVKERGMLKKRAGDIPGAKEDLQRSLQILEKWKSEMPEKEYSAHQEDIRARLEKLN
ncbi:MAG: alpha/beta hydrolase-fold protein, partial [Bacteroidota bacterium]